MPQISRTALVPFSVEQMYQLVNDVKSYLILPGCTGEPCAGVWADADDGGGGVSKQASVRPLRRNTLTSNQSILMKSGRWPFKS